jgi:hypothetical protein
MTNMSTVVIRTQQMMTISSNNNTIMMRKQKANHRLPAPAIILVYGSESILVHQIALVLFGIPLVEVLSGTYKNVIILFFLLMFVILLARSDQIRSDQIRSDHMLFIWLCFVSTTNFKLIFFYVNFHPIATHFNTFFI